MNFRLKRGYLNRIATIALAYSFLTTGAAVAQTASEITPETLQPDLQRLNGSVVFTGQTGTQAPAGSEAIGITLGGVSLQDGLPQLAAENAAFEQRLTRGRIPVSELFEATADLEAAYAEKGFILSRVVLPQQSLRDGGRLRVVVVNGFVQDIDTTNVPENTKKRVERLTDPLIDKPGLTLKELERQLLLTGDIPGTALKSALGAGDEEGGAVIALDPEFRPITGFLGFGNPSSSELGSVSLNLGVEFNSPLKFGETFYLRLSGSPEDIFQSSPRSRIFAAGAVVPLGYSGLTLNAEVTASDTTPDDPVAPTRSDFDRQSLRLSYPFIRSRELNVSGQFALDRQQDSQDLLNNGTANEIFSDDLTILRLGGNVSLFHKDSSTSDFGVTLSQGIDAFGARSAADALAQGGSLSRAGADSEFTKLVASASHRRALSDRFFLSVSGRLQTSFGDALVTSEQFGIVGAQELSSFDSGSLRGDRGWVIRSELSTQTSVSIGNTPILLNPYAFVGVGSVTLVNPTAAEQRSTDATAIGIGIDIFGQTDSNFRSSAVRIELGRGDSDDGTPDDTRFTVSGNFRF